MPLGGRDLSLTAEASGHLPAAGEFFLDGVPVEPGEAAQPPGDGGPGAAAGFQVAGEAFDLGAAGLKQAQVVQLAPAAELAQVQLIGFAGQTAVPGQESG